MPDQVQKRLNRAIDRALLVTALISLGFGKVAIVSGLLR
jgi:hypothetical protein